MGLESIPEDVTSRFKFAEYRHSCAIFVSDFAEEWDDLMRCLRAFTLKKSDIVVGGGARSNIPKRLDDCLAKRGWAEKSFSIIVSVDGGVVQTPTHKLDSFKNRIGIEVEWNNKTEFYDRDLDAFRVLHELGVLDVGVIITRQSELQTELFKPLGIHKKYGASTTHWDKLIPKVDRGGAGECPLLLVGIGLDCYDPDA